MLGAVTFGHKAFQPVIDAIVELAEACAREPREVEAEAPEAAAVREKLAGAARADLEAAYKVAAKAPGTLNPVVQMGAPEVLSQFSQDELDAVHWGEEGSWLASLVDRCIDFDINPDYDAMHDLYTQAKRARGA